MGLIGNVISLTISSVKNEIMDIAQHSLGLLGCIAYKNAQLQGKYGQPAINVINNVISFEI